MKSILIIAVVFFALGCKKEPAVPLPVIVINSPSSNQHFVKGETIHITGTITHSIALTEVSVHMTDLSTKTEFFHNHFSAGNQMDFNYDSSYPIPDNTKTSFKVEVEATDKDGISISKEILILIN